MVARRRSSKGSDRTPAKAARKSDASSASAAKPSPATPAPSSSAAAGAPSSSSSSSSSAAASGPSPGTAQKGYSRFASKHVRKILDRLIEEELSHSQNAEELRPWLEKLRAKILRQLSESSLVLFQSSENDPSELRKSVDGLLHTIKTEIAQQKDTSVRQIYGSKRESRPSLSGENLDTSFIDSKAQEICSKYKAISQNISSLLAATEDRIRVFENSLAAAARQANEPAPASSASVASAASSSARSRSAAHSLQDHLNASY